jgi:putrescine:ornithine antiporter
MTLMQLTVIVAVNMMGSGIIMLPTNMASVGAISLLSWGVAAIGSMAIAYGFAQAGVLNQRAGGMSAYAEEAYGKSGFFLVFYLYFFSLAIGNVAIAISAVGYLATFFPGLAATPIATCIGVIGLIWLTTVANFGGPKVTGRIGAVTVWGVIIPVAGLSLIGWFWFNTETFAAAWNPKGMSLGQGVGSSIALTLWAFLGMESAAQNSSAVENPKRNVPLACMLGTLGASVVYVLSTTVIQGIVPNAELADSTGPFGLAYAKMFNPTVGAVIMALAIMACLGSLLGWQFTISQTAKSAAEDRMFPAFFANVTKSGAPIAGMVVMGVVQSAMALSTISPSLAEQFSSLVNLAVVTNVIPYIIALSALIVMMKKAGVALSTYRRNVAVTVVALLYSVFAIYASGAEAVLGGTVVMAIGFAIYGFLAPRFELKPLPDAQAALARSEEALRPAAATATVLFAALVVAALPARAGTFDRVRESGKLRLGHRADAPPFSFEDASGKPAGYSVTLCERIADAVKVELGLSKLAIEDVAVGTEDRFDAVEEGKVDLLCGAATATIGRRKQVAFSVPIFPSGIGALVRKDSSESLKAALEGRELPVRPIWRGSPAQILDRRVVAAQAGTTAESWLRERRVALGVRAEIAALPGYREGVDAVLTREADAFFGDRAILLDAAAHSASPGDLVVLDRLFTYEPIALVMARGDDDFRALVDRTLSRLYRSGGIGELYSGSFGEPDDEALAFFRFVAQPE